MSNLLSDPTSNKSIKQLQTCWFIRLLLFTYVHEHYYFGLIPVLASQSDQHPAIPSKMEQQWLSRKMRVAPHRIKPLTISGRKGIPSNMEFFDFSDVPLGDLRDPRHPFHQFHMEMALEEAAQAEVEDEVPVGAVIVSMDQGVIARAHNQREQLNDPTAHAEMIALTQAAQAIKHWRLLNCVMYVTLEPCPMCAGAVVQARLPMLVYGARDAKAGACHSLFEITNDVRLNHRVEVLAGVQAERCAGVLSEFFRKKRLQSN